MEAINYSFSDKLNESTQSLLKAASILTVTDSLGRVEFANDNYCKIINQDYNKIIGEPHELLKSHLHSEKLYKNLWRTIKMGQKWNGVLKDKAQNGKMFWLDTTIIPIKTSPDNNVKFVSIYNDVTKTQLENVNLYERNLRNSKYRLIYQSINVGIIVVADEKGNISEWNQGAELAFGYSKIEILGMPLTMLIAKKFRKRNIYELLHALNRIKANKRIDTIEMSCLRKNGEEFPVEFALSHLDVNNNNFYCAVMFDITKRKKTEDKLKQKTKDLELFLYRATHDLKAPFSSAEGLINLLKDEDVNDRVKLLLSMLDTTIKSGNVLVEKLSQASVLAAKKYESERIDFNAIIESVLSILSSSANFSQFNFNVEIVNTHAFNSNTKLLTSIFQNLIQNAIKFSLKPIKKEVYNIDIKVKKLKNRVIINIRDYGQGISKGNIKKIFDLYYRANKEVCLGNGLGLYIVKNIVEELNGKITVNSVFNEGTNFRIVLPNLT